MRTCFKLSLFIGILLLSLFGFAQNNVSISDVNNATPDASSVLDVSSTSKGLLVPRVSLSSMTDGTTILLPATSLLVYNTNASMTNGAGVGYYYNAGTSATPNWQKILSGNTIGEWKLLGNAGTNATTNFLGTTDAIDLVFRTNNTEKVRIMSGGNVGIGTSTPGDKLDVLSTGGKNILLGGGATTGSELKFTNSGTAHFSVYNSGNSNLTFANTSSLYQTNTAGTALMSLTSTGNLGIGTTAPAYRLDLANSTIGYGNSNVRTEWRDNAGLQGNAGAQSGFFETVSPTNYPAGASSWWHLIDVRHSNPANNYAMQFAGSFFDQNLYFRKTNNNAAQAWTQVLTTASNLAWLTTGNSGTVAGTNFIGTTDAVDFVTKTNNTEIMRVTSGGNVGIGTSAPTYKFQTNGDIYANGGWFRVSGNQGYYFESWGGGWQMTDATWIRAYGSKPILATGGLAGYGNTPFSTQFGGNPRIYANYDNLTAGGIAISDDGGLYDHNDGWITSRGSYGIKIKHNATSSSDLLQLDMYNIAGTLQDRYLSTSNDNWGYVGISGRAWYRMYSYGFTNASQRELKKDIYPVEGKTRELVMADLDKITPYFYRYKNETTDWQEGTETKYQANFHLGMLLDETPDYIQDNAFSGVDIYAAATLGIVAAKANKDEIEAIKKVIGVDSNATKDISYFGEIELSIGESFIPYDESFRKQLNGQKPIITLSVNQDGFTVYVKERRIDGVIVVVNGKTNQKVNLNFIMMAKVKLNTNQLASKSNEINAEILNGMYVPESTKLKVQQFWEQGEVKRKEEEIKNLNEAVKVQQERKNQIENNKYVKPERN